MFRTPSLHQLTKRFARDVNGNFAMMFGLLTLPIFAGAGVAYDYTNASSKRAMLQERIDAAAIAAALSGKTAPGQLKQVVEDYLAANGADEYMDSVSSFSASLDPDTGSLSVTAHGTYQTAFLSIMGKNEVPISAGSVVNIGKDTDVEIAMALDVTGSMRDDMPTLRAAATNFVNLVKPDHLQNNDRIRVSVVPYVGAVNIGNDSTQMSWMDSDANSMFHGRFLESRWYGYTNPCANPPSGGGSWTPPDAGDDDGGDDRSSLGGWLDKFAEITGEFLGVRAAHADTVLPDGWETPWLPDCGIRGPQKVNHFDLFDDLDVSWKGCVEARPEPYDADDTPPSASNPNTRWVPYFWHDETDKFTSWVPDMPNNYMADGPIFDAWDNAAFTRKIDQSTWVRTFNLLKYGSGASTTIDETGPVTSGPNASCPDPIQPLTATRSTVLSKISSLTHYEGSGTNSAQGLVWAWRTLSSGEPFSQGKQYGLADKIIVIMTDGKNSATPSPLNAMLTDYNAYGVLYNNQRIGTNVADWTYANFSQYIDNRFAAACENAKAQGVTIYTITFGDLDSDTRTLYQNCATTPTHYLNAPTAETLTDSFKSIAQSINAIYLKK